jgi:hypothetical protein
VYCYSSTAVQLAVQFCWLLFVHTTSVETRLLYEAKVVLLQSYKAFPEVPMVQRAALRANWKGSVGRFSHGPIFSSCFQPIFFAGFIVFFVTIHFLFSVAFTSLSLPRVLLNPHPPNFRGVCPICPPTLLHCLCPHPALPSLPNPPLNA